MNPRHLERFEQIMSQFINRLPGFVIPIATILLALALGILIFYALSYLGARGKWQQLDSPPGEVLRLVTADELSVIVETAEGRTFEIECRTANQDYACIREIESPTSLNTLPCKDEDVPSPTFVVKERLTSCFEYEYIIRAQYVLREDGSLWRWKLEIYPYGQVARFFQMLCLSLILGLVVGFSILYLKRN